MYLLWADYILVYSYQLEKPITAPNCVNSVWPNLMPVSQLDKQILFIEQIEFELTNVDNKLYTIFYI